MDLVLQALFHAWERRLSDAAKNRVVRPFDWGLDWLPASARGAEAAVAVEAWVSGVMGDTDAFFTPEPTTKYAVSGWPRELDGEKAVEGDKQLTFPSALETPFRENNTVYCRLIEAQARHAGSKAAVLVLPQWNSDGNGHVGLARLLAMNGMTTLRLSLPYHDRRMPPELQRADYIVSANITRTLQSCRQAVLDARRAVWWLASQGYERIGILGSSLGSCLALLTTAHEPLIRAEALNHISPYFADVVWRGLSTRHVREGLNGHIGLDVLRELWKPISPRCYLERLRDRNTLLVYAKYDLTFPRDLSEDLVREFHTQGVPHQLSVLPCGHYSTGKSPFKYWDGWILMKFLKKCLEAGRG